MNKIAFTTPAFYASGQPHIGHLYAVILGKVLTHYFRKQGYSVFFQSGMDEHGEKIENKAHQKGLSPQEFVDAISKDWQTFYQHIRVSFDAFIRTSRDPDHQKVVQDILKHCYEKGDIYLAEHSGPYCIECEAYLTSDQMNAEGHCLIHKVPTEMRKEENYYFRLSRYKERILEALEQGLLQISPTQYTSELKGLIKQDIGDFSISRPRRRTNWGIPIPFDDQHVTYVWFDALPNYLSAQLRQANLTFSQASQLDFWDQTYHIIGKDILKFHGLYWPAMLLSCGLPLPKIMVTGWILVNDHKISKSLGNLVEFEFFGDKSLDALTSYLCSKPIGDDLHFSEADLKQHYTSFLANQIGNLHARILKMVLSYWAGHLPKQHKLEKDWTPYQTQYHESFRQFKVHEALNIAYQLGRDLDAYLSHTQPWLLWKDKHVESTAAILSTCCEGLSILHQMLLPFWPETGQQMTHQLRQEKGVWIAEPTIPLFPKIEFTSNHFGVQS